MNEYALALHRNPPIPSFIHTPSTHGVGSGSRSSLLPCSSCSGHRAPVPDPDVKGALQQLFVVSAHVDHDGKADGRRDAGTGGVERDLGDGVGDGLHAWHACMHARMGESSDGRGAGEAGGEEGGDGGGGERKSRRGKLELEGRRRAGSGGKAGGRAPAPRRPPRSPCALRP